MPPMPAEADAPPASPDDVRHLVEQFELGVARARTGAGPVHQSREPSEQ